jgi:hypothetical protein
MCALPSETPACPSGGRSQRLAVLLADMIPGAASIRVTLADPLHAWPHPHATAQDAAGQELRLSRTTAKVAARWIIRVWPEADWTRGHTFDLAAARLFRSDMVSAGQGR